MGFQNDAFSLSFDELFKRYPNRHIDIYRYRVKNYKTTLNKIVIKPKRSVILILEDETKLQAVQDTYQSNKTTITINSNQSSGTAQLFNNETITIITSELIKQDYRNEFYIYSTEPIPKKQLSTTELYLDQLGASTFPDYQEPYFLNAKDQEEKVTNVLILNKLSLNTAGTNTNIYSYNDETIDYFDGNIRLLLQSPGPIADFGASFLDDQDHKRQLEYKLLEDINHAYALLQMQPTKIKPNITFSSDTYDQNKNITFERARRYIGGFKNISETWEEFGKKTTGNDAAGKLYWAFLTIVFLSNERLTKFKDFRIDDKDNLNFGKIDTTLIATKLYGLAIDDILTIDQKEFTATILKAWEQEFSSDLDTDDKLIALYQVLKGILAALTEFIPSPYSFGSYQKIGRLAIEWYLVPKTMKITADNVFNRVSWQVRLESEKYRFDKSNLDIAGLKDNFLKISGVRTFNLDGQITLPSVPEILSEENKDTSAGSVSVENINFLNYTWVFQLLDKSKYRQLFFIDNPFIINGRVSNTKAVKGDPLNNGVGNISGDTVDEYVKQKFLITGRELIDNSASAEIKEKDERYIIRYDSKPGGLGGGSSSSHLEPVYGTRKIYTTEFKWLEEPIPQANINQISPPFSINQAQWELFETSSGKSINNFILDPILNIGDSTVKRRLCDIHWKNTFSNFSIITLTAVKNDGTIETLNFEIEQAYKNDQTITQEGILI